MSEVTGRVCQGDGEGAVGVASRRSLGRSFRWLWAAYAVSAYGSGLGLGAFSLVAILALHAGPTEVSPLLLLPSAFTIAAAGCAIARLVIQTVPDSPKTRPQ